MRVRGVTLGLVFAFLAVGCAEDLSLPDELVGKYTTSAPRYANRYMELSAVEVSFGLGEEGSSRHTIRSVSREEDNGKTLYTIAYAGDGGTDRLRFHYDDQARGQIVIENQIGVTWTLEGVER